MSPLIPIPTPRVSIPERTVDAWVAIFLATEFPNIRLWAPTTRGWDDWDYAGDPGLSDGKLFVLECKSTVPVGTDHIAKIGWRQFHRYLALPLTRSITYYVFPSPPWIGSPAIPPPLVPAEADRWQDCKDWLHVVSARDLRRHYGVQQDTEVPSTDLPLITGSRTLGEFATALRSCHAGRLYRGGQAAGGSPGANDGPSEPDNDTPDEADLRSLGADAGMPVMTPTVGFIPAQDLA